MKYGAAFLTVIFGIIALILLIPVGIILLTYIFCSTRRKEENFFNDAPALPDHFMFDGRETLNLTTVKYFHQKHSI